jgi:hypothetical protein
MAITLKKLSICLKALLTPEFGAKVEMPALSLNGTLVTATAQELNFVDGVTSNVQTQLTGKAASAHVHAGADVSSGTLDGDRLPAMSTTKKGAVPLSTTATGSQVLADNGWTSKNNVFSAFSTLADGAIVTWNMATQSYNAKVTLGGNRTLSITNAVAGMSGCLIVIQDGTGGRGLVAPAGSYMINGYTSFHLTSGANKIDILTFTYDGTNFYWSWGNNYTGMI